MDRPGNRLHPAGRRLRLRLDLAGPTRPLLEALELDRLE